MKRTKLTVMSALVAVNMLSLGSAFAMSSDSLPPMKTQGSISYLTGGVGKDEAEAIKLAAPKYPLSLEFVQHAKPKNEFLANVDVTIVDQAGATVLKTVSDGPFLLAKVPHGRYTVMAEVNGKTKTMHTTVAAHNPKHLVVVW